MEKFVYYSILIGLSFLTGAICISAIRKILTALINRNSKTLNTNPTNFIFLKNSVSFIVYSFVIMWIFIKIPYFNALGNALFAGAGVLAAVIGFASQKAFSNIIGGLFILIFKPFSVGDVIEISNNRKGKVEEITLRHTVIKDYEFRRVVIPNSTISDETIINSSITDSKIRKHVEFGIAYDVNIDQAISIIQDEVRRHPNYIDNRTAEDIFNNISDVEVKVIALDDFAVTLRAYVWSEDNDKAFDLKCAVLKSVKEAFDQNGIEIPFPYRTLVFKDNLKIQTTQDEIPIKKENSTIS